MVLPAPASAVQPLGREHGIAVEHLHLVGGRVHRGDGGGHVTMAEALHARGIGKAREAQGAADEPTQAVRHIWVIGTSAKKLLGARSGGRTRTVLPTGT